MNDLLKKILGIEDPAFCDTPSPAEQELERISHHTRNVLTREHLQIVRNSRMMPSWESTYGLGEQDNATNT